VIYAHFEEGVGISVKLSQELDNVKGDVAIPAGCLEGKFDIGYEIVVGLEGVYWKEDIDKDNEGFVVLFFIPWRSFAD
jgi:hypothetical protein